MGRQVKMTEALWKKDRFVASMLYCLRDRGITSVRKLRLFAVACCRLVWHRIEDPRSRVAVEVGERYADGLADARELEQADMQAMSALDEICTARGYDIRDVLRKAPFVFPRGAPTAIRWACAAAWSAAEDAERAAWTAEGVSNTAELATNCDLLRDIFGNPFRPVAVDPAWLTSDVVALAEGVYEERAFDRLPILADALMDAGCDNADLLGHLRGEGPHVRGCWALDLILGKE